MTKFTNWLFKRSIAEIGHRARMAEQDKIIAKAKRVKKMHKLLIKQSKRNDKQNKLAEKIKELSKEYND